MLGDQGTLTMLQVPRDREIVVVVTRMEVQSILGQVVRSSQSSFVWRLPRLTSDLALDVMQITMRTKMMMMTTARIDVVSIIGLVVRYSSFSSL